jgi:hypothetical protein
VGTTSSIGGIGKDVTSQVNSYIQNLHMKSSMLYLWLITAVIGYGSKLPYIGRIIALMSVV